MRLTIATWNINSVRLRIGLVERFLTEVAPDVLCLQETKSPVDLIPTAELTALGYEHMVARGQKGYNGVAIVSKHPIDDVGSIDFCDMGDARHTAARLAGGPEIHCVYVPAGGDAPDPDANPKFDHKLKFVDEIAERFDGAQSGRILVGDLNIAPLETDVWSHKQLLNVVSHTPIEVEKFTRAQETGGWVDATRAVVPPETKLYSWWSYRARDWAASDRGRRLDHIWLSPDLAPGLRSSTILKEARGWEKPSDHAPVIATVEI